MALPQPQHQAVHGDPGQRVERAERLVQQEQAGLADQGPGQRRPLGLAAGQGQRPGVRPFGQADLLQRPASHRAGVRHAQPEGHVGQHPAPRQQPRLLERDRDRPRHAQLAGDLAVQPGQRAQQRGLAGPAHPEHGHELARGDIQVHAVEHLAAAERPAQPAHPRGGPGRNRQAGYPRIPRRHASALLSSSRTRASVIRPRTA